MATRRRWDVSRELLGAMTDAELARRLGIPRTTIRDKRRQAGIPSQRTPWDDEPDLGRLSDAVLARRHGVTKNAVRNARLARGIAATQGDPQKGIDWDAQPLGAVSDCALAAALGCSRSTVRSARLRRLIPAWSPGRDGG